jgi:hypothetical protein
MKPNEKNVSPVILMIFALVMLPMALWFILCGIHYSVDGQVLDANTGQPVKAAVVVVNWQRTKLGIPGLPVPFENHGTFESVTDRNGTFTVPKYLIGHHYMAVYKSGYICWSSKTIFNPDGKDWKEMFKHRYGHRIKSGMVLKLKPKDGNFPEVKHAAYVYMNVDTQLSAPKPFFDEATSEERMIFRNSIRRHNKEQKE